MKFFMSRVNLFVKCVFIEFKQFLVIYGLGISVCKVVFQKISRYFGYFFGSIKTPKKSENSIEINTKNIKNNKKA